jgi:flagellar hook-associated protein 2
MAGLQLSGLASGLDWKTLVDQLMQIEATPITRIQKEQSTNTQQANALGDLGTKLSALQNAAKSLKDQTLFSARTISSGTTDSTWRLSATAGAAVGSHTIAVSQLATKAARLGAADITSGLNATADVSGLTLATLRTAAVVTAGSFTVNGAQVTVATTDSLQDVFDAIATATGGDVTAAYDPVTDKVTLTKATPGEIVLGAANDTSNLLGVLKLTSSTGTTATSFGTLGAARTSATLATAGLRTAITAVDGDGAGSFTINGVSIDYNVNTDSLSSVLKRINSSAAGVTASYDAVADRVILTNNATGDLGLTISEAAGGLLGALGLTDGGTTVRGQNARFTVDGGDTIISTSNTLDATAHGLPGLTLTVDSATTQTVTIGADTGKMRGMIDSFISAYNAVRLYIDDKTKITSANGKVTTSVLSSNREVQAWQSELRRLAFGTLSGVGGTISRLDDLGIGLDQDGRLSVQDSTKLDTALADRPADVESFFTTPSTGFAARFETLTGRMIDSSGDAQTRLNKQNTDLDRQIDDLQRRLDQQRELLTNSFIAMETAQSRIQQQSAALTRAFGTDSSSK